MRAAVRRRRIPTRLLKIYAMTRKCGSASRSRSLPANQVSNNHAIFILLMVGAGMAPVANFAILVLVRAVRRSLEGEGEVECRIRRGMPCRSIRLRRRRHRRGMGNQWCITLGLLFHRHLRRLGRPGRAGAAVKRCAIHG